MKVKPAAAFFRDQFEAPRLAGERPRQAMWCVDVSHLKGCAAEVGLAPVKAVNRALAKAGKGFNERSVLEVNEAFAAQVLGCLAEWPELDPAILNPQDGAIALGHPLGASGAASSVPSSTSSPARARAQASLPSASASARASSSSLNAEQPGPNANDERRRRLARRVDSQPAIQHLSMAQWDSWPSSADLRSSHGLIRSGDLRRFEPTAGSHTDACTPHTHDTACVVTVANAYQLA
ncbi:hypothetical protein ACQP1W_22140 [Spirillospora sp. CA-255316]